MISVVRSPVAVVERPGFDIQALPMPMPSERFGVWGSPAGITDFSADLAVALRPSADELTPPDTLDERAFYRWLLGHHVTFCIWRRITEVLEFMVHDGPTRERVDEVAWWYDCYSAMFLYAGSCTAGTYARAIRSEMAAAHPGFSGVWARDYERILQLLGRLSLPANSTLKAALMRNRLVHVTVAKALVPQGASLLKQSGRRANQGATDAERDLFDRFFLIERGPVTRDTFVAHAIRRMAAVQCDLLRHPLDISLYEDVCRQLPGDLPAMVRDMAVFLASTHSGGMKCTA
ncbi:hypothetical protein [Amycolatopsis sp. NPDC049868]|uniref:hypothetical protein n=1 Tax=Amycolatopsis sp. NPDC049868 TaxID=3363934 RepID=UPI0037B81D13